MSLNVPIFNRFSTRNSVRSARIDRDNQVLKLEDAKKSLYKEIQQVYYNAIAAESRYVSSRQAVASNEDAFRLTQGKYENGKASITEFNEAKNISSRHRATWCKPSMSRFIRTVFSTFIVARVLTFRSRLFVVLWFLLLILSTVIGGYYLLTNEL